MNTDHSHYLGLTWDHPRGYEALFKASELNNNQATNSNQSGSMTLHWHTQPLEGFESTPLANLANDYDLLVIDHPHIGEAIDTNCLLPLEDFYSEQQIVTWQKNSVGGAMQSYCWQGKHWALPLDVASQVQAYRPDHFERAGLSVPDTWAAISKLPESIALSLSLNGPHALSTLYSICRSFNIELAQEQLFEPHETSHALELLQSLYQRCQKNNNSLNPIELLEKMSSTDDISLIPLIFGYVNYSKLTAESLTNINAQVLFCDALTAPNNKIRGSILGGTGIALTKRCTPNAGLLEHLKWLMDSNTQTEFIPRHAGQPSSRTAWANERLNNDWGSFYSHTLATINNAFIRPRYNGYLAFHNEASACVNNALETRANPKKTIEEINRKWQMSQPR